MTVTISTTSLTVKIFQLRHYCRTIKGHFKDSVEGVGSNEGYGGNMA